MFGRYEIYWVNLDPTVGSEIKKNTPCVIISPNEMNDYLKTVIIAPLTSTNANIPTRVFVKASNDNGLANDSYVVIDQVKAIDKSRLVNLIGKLSSKEAKNVSDVLCEMFEV